MFQLIRHKIIAFIAFSFLNYVGVNNWIFIYANNVNIRHRERLVPPPKICVCSAKQNSIIMHWFLPINSVGMLNNGATVIWIKFRLYFWEGLKKVEILFTSDCFTQSFFCFFGKDRWKTNWRFPNLCKDCLKYTRILWLIYQS